MYLGYVCIDESMMKLTFTYRRFTCFENRLIERWIHAFRRCDGIIFIVWQQRKLACELKDKLFLHFSNNLSASRWPPIELVFVHHVNRHILCQLLLLFAWFIRAHCLPLNAFEFLHDFFFVARPRYGRLKVSIEKRKKIFHFDLIEHILFASSVLRLKCPAHIRPIYGLVLRMVRILVHIICIQHPQYTYI